MTEPKGCWTRAMEPTRGKSGTNSMTVSSSHAYLIQPMNKTTLPYTEDKWTYYFLIAEVCCVWLK